MSLDFDQLLNSHEFSRFLFDNLSSAVFLLDENIRIQKVNNSYKILFSKEENEVLEQLCGNAIGCAFAVEENKNCGTTTECKTCLLRQSILQSLAQNADTRTLYLSRNFYISGQPVFKHLRIKAKGIHYQNQPLIIVTVDDITELEEQKNKIREMANRDYLTGLYNRRYLYEAGCQLIQLALRGELQLVVALLDIDHFKNVNDTYGHQAGDLILIGIADLLDRHLRKADLLVRYGGEEFCLLLNVKEKHEAYQTMEKLRETIATHPFSYNGQQIQITISCGLSGQPSIALDQMIQQADAMLYQAKESGRNCTRACGL